MFISKEDGSSVLFLEKKLTIGGAVLVLNPRFVGEWAGLPVFSTRDPLWPVVTLPSDFVPLPLSLTDEVSTRFFDVRSDDLEVMSVTMLVACGNAFCDGRYGINCPCSRHKLPLLTLPSVELRVGEVEFARFSSVELALCFFDQSQLLSTTDVMDMADHVRRSLSHYVDGVRLCGWLKPAVAEADDFATVAKAHISKLTFLGAQPPRYVAGAEAGDEIVGAGDEFSSVLVLETREEDVPDDDGQL